MWSHCEGVDANDKLNVGSILYFPSEQVSS